MKVLAFNCSPNMEKSNTALILNPFLEGIREEGGEVELLYLRRLKINPCLGEFACWFKTPGKCIHNDDMEKVYPKLKEADILVFGTPVYIDGMPGPMKTLFDRMLPLGEPFIELRENHCRHPARNGKQRKFVLVANCGFWEMDNFTPLLVHVKAICKNFGWEYAGALLRPHGGVFGYMLRKGFPVQDIVEAAKKAGRELVKYGKIKEETLKTVSRELISLEDYVKTLNQLFERTLQKYGSRN
ncbi:flavodoxin family protein [Candidatus Bathyarchaeota archaeon]|nr:MAG: flavodoxin family protein [Candidatus Bathyarchaeota archaeon]